MNRKPKHDKLVDILFKRLQAKSYTQNIWRELEYGETENDIYRTVGECDVLTLQNKRTVYYEVKSTDTPIAYEKAINQINRWCEYSGNKYGVYVTPTRIKLIRYNPSGS